MEERIYTHIDPYVCAWYQFNFNNNDNDFHWNNQSIVIYY